MSQRLFAGYARGRYAGAALEPEATVEAVLAQRTKLGDEQVAMVRAREQVTRARSGHSGDRRREAQGHQDRG